MSGDAILVCEGLNKRYGAVQAVKDVTFSLRRGEILGLVGPNGAGKTTLVDLIAGEQRADSGFAAIGGKQLSGPPSRRARVNGLARTFQHPQVALELTVRENILVGLAAASLGSVGDLVLAVVEGCLSPGTTTEDKVVETIAATVGLPEISRRCSELTLGQLRLVEVARALVANPLLILLDEPFAGGDVHGVAGITKALQEIVKTGVSVILVDHNVDLVAALVNRIVLLNFGEVVFDGNAKECLASPAMRDVYFGATHL